MEYKSLWKNFLLLTIGSLLVFNMSIASAEESTDSPSEEGCFLEAD